MVAWLSNSFRPGLRPNETSNNTRHASASASTRPCNLSQVAASPPSSLGELGMTHTLRSIQATGNQKGFKDRKCVPFTYLEC